MELKKLIVFVAIITTFTSSYASFLATVMKQGFLTDHFWVNWLSIIPQTYLLLFPFILITGPIARGLVDRIFRKGKETNT